MATRMASPLAGFRWLGKAINVGGRNPATLLLAAFLVALVAFVPSLVTLPVQYFFPNDTTLFVAVMVLSLLVGLLLSPVFAGFLQVIDAIESGRPARARDVFAPYHTGVWKPVVGFSLCMWALYVVALLLVVLALGPEMRQYYADALAAVQTEAPPHFDTLPPGFVRAMIVAAVSGVLLGGIWALGYGQVAIARRPVFAAFADGIAGTLKNLPAIVALLIGGALLAIVFVLVFLLLAALIGMIGKFAGMWLAYVLLVPFYLAFVLGMYVLGFGVAYYFWRDVCGPP